MKKVFFMSVAFLLCFWVSSSPAQWRFTSVWEGIDQWHDENGNDIWSAGDDFGEDICYQGNGFVLTYTFHLRHNQQPQELFSVKKRDGTMICSIDKTSCSWFYDDTWTTGHEFCELMGCPSKENAER